MLPFTLPHQLLLSRRRIGYVGLYRLHRMHEMETIVTDDRGVSPAVCRYVCLSRDSLCNNGRTNQDIVWSHHNHIRLLVQQLTKRNFAIELKQI